MTTRWNLIQPRSAFVERTQYNPGSADFSPRWGGKGVRFPAKVHAFMATDSSTPAESEIEQAPEMPPATDAVFGLQRVDEREKALPVRPGDLTRLLMAQPGLTAEERKDFGRLCPRIGAWFHHEFYQRLRELKETYAPLDPDSDYAFIEGHTRIATSTLDEEFLSLFEATLERANYHILSNDILLEAVQAPNETGLNYIPDFTLFEHLRVYARGFKTISRVSRNLNTKFRKRTAVLEAYQRLIVILKFNEGRSFGPHIQSDKVYLRMFKDVPHVDMEMHLPEQGTRVKMRMLDKAQIASPLMVGLPTLAAKLIVAGLTLSPGFLIPALFAPVSAGVNSFFGFQRAKQKHLSHMIRNLYYLTLANNGSVLTRLIDSAEEEEYKETLLAYFFLWRHLDAESSMRVEDLDLKIEAFLKDFSGQEINFEISDALGKVLRLGLAHRTGDGRVTAVSPTRAIAVLDHLWNNAYRLD